MIHLSFALLSINLSNHIGKILCCRYQQVKFWEAKEDYQQALLLNPAVGAFHYNLSTILYRMGEYRSALAGFEKAVAIAPSNPEFVEALTACQQRVQLE